MTQAVAGSRKTQSIVDACKDGSPERRRLVISYTQTGQIDLARRLEEACGPEQMPEVMGWYAFLLRHWIRPFLPNFIPGRRLRGLNFDGEPAAGRYATGADRYLDAQGQAFKLHLSKLAVEVSNASSGAVVNRLERIYDEIYVDEVQDMTGCDLHVLEAIMKSGIHLFMVGDIRQSVFDTNPRDRNLTRYRGLRMMDWFTERRDKGLLELIDSNVTWRSNQAIADFSDTLFRTDLGFARTVSQQTDVTGHDGVFAVSLVDLQSYLDYFDPLPLRPSKATARDVELSFRNFGVVKGLTVDRVIIFPSRPIEAFIRQGAALADSSACGLYVGVTRARHSVAFALADVGDCPIEVWQAS